MDGTAKKTILVVDDDPAISAMLAEQLTSAGYDAVCAYSGSEALLAARNYSPDLVLLDLSLPGKSGEEVLRELGTIPVIIVSARSDIDGKVRTLLAGAADYVTKPFEFAELEARIRVALRKNSGTGEELRCGPVTIDAAKRKCLCSGAEVRLTRTEYAILKALVVAGGNVLTKNQLMTAIEEDTPDCEESSLKTHVANLRAKLKTAGGYDLIRSVWGIGYTLCDK